MGNRKRIGYGSLDWKGNTNSRIWLRNEFLRTIERLEPKKQKKPLGDLAKLPLDQYANYMEDIPRRRGVSESFSEKRKTLQEGERVSRFSLLDQGDPLRASVRQWGETYHLNSTWCYDVALRTLQDWHEFKETAGKRFTSLPFYSDSDYIGLGALSSVQHMAKARAKLPASSLTKEQVQLVNSFSDREQAFLSVYPYDPKIDEFVEDGTTREIFRNETKAVIEGALSLPVFNLLSRTAREELRRALNSSAERLSSKVRRTAKKIYGAVPSMKMADASKHVDWAVRYQVFDQSYYSIEGHKYENQKDKQRVYANVRKQSRYILELIDLAPRTNRQGRNADL